MEGPQRRPSALLTLRRVLREQRRIVLGITLTFFAVALVFDLQVRDTFLATARVEAVRLTLDAPAVGLRALWPTEPYAATERRLDRLAHRPEVQRDALRRLDPRDRLAYAGLRVTGNNGSRVDVVVPDVDDGRAVRRADALASALADAYTEQQIARLDQFIERVDRVRRTFPRGRDATLVDLIERLPYDQLAITLATIRGSARPGRVIQSASVPDDPFFSRGRLGQPAVMIGFALALVVALVVDAVRRRPRDPAVLARAAGLPVLARVPPPRGKHDRGEAYGHAAAGIEHIAEPAPRVVVVTSSLPGEGAPEAALGLARAASAGGRRVLLVECDLRRPGLVAQLGGGHGPGLVQVLRDRGLLAEALRPVPGAPTARALAAGATSRESAELLASRPFARLLAELSAHADLVVLAAPPLLVAADARVLVAHADAAVLCARLGRSTVDDLAAARRSLERLPERPAGLIVHGVTGEALHGSSARGPQRPASPDQAPPVPAGAAR